MVLLLLFEWYFILPQTANAATWGNPTKAGMERSAMTE